MLKRIFTIMAFIVLCTGMIQHLGEPTAYAAGNDRGRQPYGPFTISAASTCYPSDNGFDAKFLDGDIVSIYIWSIGSGALSVTPQITGFTLAEDPNNTSWYSLTARDDNNYADSIVGPIERMRFCTTTCTGDCTTKVKVIGRVHP